MKLDPQLIKLLTCVASAGIVVLSAFLPEGQDIAAEALRVIAGSMVTGVLVRRPGDVSVTAHPDDV